MDHSGSSCYSAPGLARGAPMPLRPSALTASGAAVCPGPCEWKSCMPLPSLLCWLWVQGFWFLLCRDSGLANCLPRTRAINCCCWQLHLIKGLQLSLSLALPACCADRMLPSLGTSPAICFLLAPLTNRSAQILQTTKVSKSAERLNLYLVIDNHRPPELVTSPSAV